MTFQDFFNKYNGKPIEREDPANANQCMDLAFAWCDEQGIPRETIRHLYAYQVFTLPNEVTRRYFDLIPNTPDGVPQKGDLVVFGTAVGVAGHICIASGKGDVNTFESLDQNWAGKQYAIMVNHSYNGVLGWLRAKPQPTAPTPAPSQDTQKIIDELRIARDNNHNLLMAEKEQTSKLSKRVAELEGAVRAGRDALAKANV